MARMSKKNRKKRRQQRQSKRLGVESLEARQLLAVSPVHLIGGTLMIDGSLEADHVEVREIGGEIRAELNGETYDFASSRVDRIVFNGGDGNDDFRNHTDTRCTVNGGNGADLIYGGNGNDVLMGGAGDDRIYGRGGNDNIWGNSGHDRLYGGSGTDWVYGDGGNDWVYGGSGNDTLRGGTGNDRLYGQNGQDRLYGQSGHDYLFGHNGDDRLRGDSGNDRLYGGAGDDDLFGQSGHDYLYGEFGNDTLHGGSGNDRLDGGIHDDVLYGDSGADRLYGGIGDDSLWGGRGSDYLYGGSGDDGLCGGADGTTADTLRGGTGDDRFLAVQDAGESPADRITDLHSRDARITFINGEAVSTTLSSNIGAVDAEAASWSDTEIELIDEAFAALVGRIGNTTLLKKADGSEMEFIRQGRVWYAPSGALNTTVRGWNGGGRVTIVDNGFRGNDVRRTVLHEIGHNWDQESENEFVDEFRAAGGWEEFPGVVPAGHEQATDGGWSAWYFDDIDGDRDGFARNYGKMNPKEDFATAFAAYMLADMGEDYRGESPTAVEARLADRFAVLDDFFDSLA